ncbi:SAM-dependent methyltransferase [Pseudonocardia humida]|uniref:SAM-dependent methyltransferase n=1 Tax=Pseudonocardia humida TaxID=2800819 RepID=UPI00207D6DCC|nr:class I SAM-dependent methyltransferase [Pseudonocardia humida]
MPASTATAEDYRDGFYRGLDVPADWGTRPNPLLAAGVEGLAPGATLDLACGMDGEAIWRAGRDWRVTAVDVSPTVLRRAAELTAAKGVADRIAWQAHDLSRTFPEGASDLVSAQFPHSPVAAVGGRESVLAGAAEAVAPGGVLLVGSHAGWPSWVTEAPFAYHFATAAPAVSPVVLVRLITQRLRDCGRASGGRSGSPLALVGRRDRRRVPVGGRCSPRPRGTTSVSSRAARATG